MSQIVKGEVAGVPIRLFLPCHRPIRADTLQNTAAVGALRDLDPHMDILLFCGGNNPEAQRSVCTATLVDDPGHVAKLQIAISLYEQTPYRRAPHKSRQSAFQSCFASPLREIRKFESEMRIHVAEFKADERQRAATAA